VPGDDETEDEGLDDKRAEQALARARALVEKQNPQKKRDPGRWLALVPLTIAVLMMALMMPRATTPDAVPLPTLDVRALSEVMRADDARVAKAKSARLPSDVLGLGSAVRAIQAVQLNPEANENDLQTAQATLEEARRILSGRNDWQDDVLALRALQMSAFLEELARYEQTGQSTKDLDELGGGFIRRMRSSGWADGNRVLLDEGQRRAIFKTVWNALAGVDGIEAFTLKIDEQRALYTLYIGRPYPGDASQRTLDAMRRDAKSADQCARAAIDDRRAREVWRAEKIKRFGQIDPSYPTAYALGVAYYRGGRYDLSSDAFRAWIDAHPDGPLSTRARNHLKAALDAHGAI
jgi:tetratricopeptide (TPR) repeat protein